MTDELVTVGYLASLVVAGPASIDKMALRELLETDARLEPVQLRKVDRNDLLAVYRARRDRGSLRHVIGGATIVDLLELATDGELRMGVVELPSGAVLSAWLASGHDSCVAAILVPARVTKAVRP